MNQSASRIRRLLPVLDTGDFRPFCNVMKIPVAKGRPRRTSGCPGVLQQAQVCFGTPKPWHPLLSIRDERGIPFHFPFLRKPIYSNFASKAQTLQTRASNKDVYDEGRTYQHRFLHSLSMYLPHAADWRGYRLQCTL